MATNGRAAAPDLAALFGPPSNAVREAADRSLDVMHVVLGAREALVGQTPKDIVWQKNKSRLYRYRRQTPPTQQTPIFFSMPMINRPYVVDLTPGNSLIEFLIDRGFDVFLYDWGTWGPEDRNLTVGDLLARYLRRAVREASKTSGQDVTLLGYCIGGTLAAALAARYPELPVKNLVLFTAPIDFSQAGDFGTWVAKGSFPIEMIREVLPSMPGELVDVGSKMLNPLPNTVGNYVRLWGKLGDPNFDVKAWQAMHRWVNEGTPFPVGVYYEWITQFYQGNSLVQDLFEVDGQPVRLSDIRIPVLNVAASADTIAPRATTNVILGLVSSEDKEELLLRGGHVGIVVGRSAKQNLWPQVADWLTKRDK